MNIIQYIKYRMRVELIQKSNFMSREDPTVDELEIY